jgi:hypothetical protein
MRSIRRAVLLPALLMASSLQAQSTLPKGTWRVGESPSELRYPISRADLIVASMQDALIHELTVALNKGGPAFAIKSCHIDVIGVIQRIGRQEGIAAGRTSDRLRSPTNAPRPWAAPLVKAYSGRRPRDVEGFAATKWAFCDRLRSGPSARLATDRRKRSALPFAESSATVTHATRR